MLRIHALLPVLFTLVWLAAASSFAAGQVAPGDPVRVVRTPDPGGLGIRFTTDAQSRRATVASIAARSPAAEAGVLPGDVVVALDGRPIMGDHEILDAMRDVEPGGKVALDLHRHGRSLRVYLIARAVESHDPQLNGWLPPPAAPGHLRDLPPMASWSADDSGVGCGSGPGAAWLATLTPQLARYFGTEQGVLVVRAPIGGAFRLEDGDVLTAIDGRVPRDGPHALAVLQSYRPGEKLELQVLRQRRLHRIEVEVPRVPGAPATPHRP